METTTPFDLNQAILQWRESLQQSPAFCRENLEELESHLRDSIISLKQRGLTADEAFLIATRRAGDGMALVIEYGKINTRDIWLNRAMWMLIGTQFFNIVNSLVSSISVFIVYLSYRPLMGVGNSKSTGLWYHELLTALANLLPFAITLGVGWWLLMRKGNSISAWLQKAPSHAVRRVAVGASLIYIFLRVIFLKPYLFSHMSDAGMAGMGLAWLVESIVLVLLTLFLARRQWLAKT